MFTGYPQPQAFGGVCFQCGTPSSGGWCYCASLPVPLVQVGSWSERSSSGPSVGNLSAAENEIHYHGSKPGGFTAEGSAAPGVQYTQAPRSFVAAVGSNCQCCGKTIDTTWSLSADICSKRCEWVLHCQCPQCGRSRACDSLKLREQPYCSASCASQSHQANWCPSCGVKQILAGSTHCSALCYARASSNFPIRLRRKVAQYNSCLRHEIMSEKERAAVLQSARNVFSANGLVVVNVVKCTPHTVRRKNYLTYRSHVEQEMTSRKQLTKYGYGGEGNEQRRYVPLLLKCTMGPGANPFAVGGSAADCCADTSCSACFALRNGFSLEGSGAVSHYCTTELELSVLHAVVQRNPGSLCAVGVCRAVIGVPAFVKDPSQIVPGADGSHCTIITSADCTTRNEGTYLFRDDALELQYVVLFQ